MPEVIPPLLIYLAIALAAAALLWYLGRKALSAITRRLLMQRYENAEIVETIMDRRISQGMTPEMVTDAWGKPAEMTEKVMKTKTKREMKYDPRGRNRFGTRVYFEDDVVVGWETK